jgi:glutamate synthase domain-containing protein 1
MCGIIGFMDRTGSEAAPVGEHLLRMLAALGSRGPDSAGVAIFGPGDGRLLLRVKLGEDADRAGMAEQILQRAASVAHVSDHSLAGSYLRLALEGGADLPRLMQAIEGETPHSPHSVEVISAGRRLEILKQVGSPENLERSYGISRLRGTHGIGHTRLSTESRVDLSHSQPFWARGTLDVAAVHNGHITNYHKLRRLYEQRGTRFCTENDSEIIGIYLRSRLERGDSLEEALRASMTDLDGSFCYLVATDEALAFVKDPYGLKPLVVAETPEWVAIATEEGALRQAFGSGFEAREPGTRAVRVWNLVRERELARA